MHRHTSHGALVWAPIVLAAGAIALAGPNAAQAGSGGEISGGAGIDYQTGPGSRSYRGTLLFASANAPPGDLTIGGIRFDDSHLGPGIGGFANSGVRLGSALGLRAMGAVTRSDDGFDAWRLRAGPELRLVSNVTLGAFYLRHRDESAMNLSATGFEVSFPVSRTLSAR